MVKIQIDLTEEEDRKVSLIQVDKNDKTKAIAIKRIIKEFPSMDISIKKNAI